MLFAISLAQKLGVNHRLQAYSVHPGASVWTNLLGHLDPNEWAPEYRTCLSVFVCTQTLANQCE